ncbi:MAG TPA: immunoglobulin domain-containing protein [Terriglobales bacterium]|nr:immunoglobulin domain-containing protein [Terriglobales bacterium]
MLSQSGIVQVLAMGELDTRPFTNEEMYIGRTPAFRAQLPSDRKAPWSGQSETWNVVKSSAVSAPLAGDVRLMAVSLAHARPLDLMVVDSSDTRLHVLPANTGSDSAGPAGELTIETGDSPRAVLPMRVNVDARRGLLMVGGSAPHPRTMAPLPDPTYTVNRLDDPASSVANAATYCNGVANDCSLRQAVIKANSTAGSDTIMLPAGTITLTQTGQHENAAVTGDVDVTDSLAIVGSVDGGGNPTSIITGGAGWNDKFISTNKLGVTNANLSISNVIFQNGNNTNTSGGATFDYLGGAVDFFGCGSAGGAGGCAGALATASLTITNVRFLNNTAAGCGAGNDCGGGLDSEFGPTTVSTSLFSGNTASLGRGGALTLVGGVETMSVSNSTFDNSSAANHSAQEGGALYIDFANTSGAGNISIHNSTFSSNTAGADGGGIYVNLGSGGNTTTATIDQTTVISGNSSATRGGGLAFNGITGTLATPGTTSLSISKVTITSNQANGASADGGGGIFVQSGGTLNLQFSRIVGNTTAASGKPTGISIEAGSGGSASTVNAADNWWGCNTGPSAAPCDTVATVNGASPVATVSPWIVLTLAASPTSVQAVAPDNTSSLTADFLHDSASGAISLSNIDVLLGLPITFGATAGSISGADATIQSTGMATATFTHDANCNASSATATVDTSPPPTVTTPITILCPDLTATKTNSLGASGVTTPLASPSWTWTITEANSNAADSAPAKFTNGETILSDSLPSSNISYGSATPGSFSGITNSGNISCGIASNVLTCGANGSDVTIGIGGSFQVSFTATATAGGSYVNPTGGTCAADPNGDIIEFNKGNNACGPNTVVVVAPPSIAKAFNPNPIAVNATTSLTFTITNPAANTVSLAGVGFSDTLPTGLTVADSSASKCGGTLTTTASTGIIALSGASIAAGGQCQFSVTVTGTAAGNYTNTSGNVTSTNGGTGNTATANLVVASPPTISKAFSPTSIPLNGTSTVTFSISNPNPGLALTGVAFSDTLPSGVQVASAPNTSNTCNGTLTATAGTSTISLLGGTLVSSGSCSISVDVKGTTSGAKSNTTSTISSTESGTGATSNTATLTVVAPPTISKAFLASSIALNGTTTLTFTINNPNTSTALSGISFGDSLPSGVQVAATPNITGVCGGTVTATAGSGSISLSGGTLASSGSCTISVDVTGTTAGAKSNTTGAISSAEGGTGATSNTASLTVVAPPSISKAFTAGSIQLNTSTNLSFTITNPTANTVALTGVGFTDPLPSGLAVSNPSVVTGSCGGGTITATASSSTISLSGATINTGSSCTFSVSVTGTATGTQNNTTGAVTSTNGGTGNMATASVTVTSKPVITTQPANQTVCEGTKVTFTAAASGVPTPTVQWQVSLDGGAHWFNIPGATSTSLTFPAIALANGTKYRAVFTNTFGTATTNAATLTVNTDPEITTQPNNQKVKKGHSVTFTAAAIGRPTPTVQWQVSTNGGTTWTNISGATSTTLTFTAAASQDNNQYRAVFTNTCGTAATRAAILDVD